MLFILLFIPVFCLADITLTNEQIRQMPVETLSELLCSQPGVTFLDEKIQVDGFDKGSIYFLLNDSHISSSTALTIDLSIIEKLEILTSYTAAETTEIYPIVIRIQTISKIDRLAVDINTVSDQLSSADSWNKNRISAFLNIPIYKKLTLSGFTNVDRNDTRFRGYYKNDPVKDLKYLLDDFSDNDPYEN